MASPIDMKRASAGARGYAVHPKVKIGGSLVLARPDALLNKEQFDAEMLVFNWALKQVQGNMERIRAAHARLRPFEFDGDQNNRRNFVRARNALQDAQFREAWLKQGIVYITNLWDATKDKIKNIEALKAQAAKAALMAEKERIIAQIAALAAEANKASQDAAASLLAEDTTNAKSGIAPPGEPTEPTDAGIVETVLDLPENASTAMLPSASVKETISAKKAADAIADTTEESFLSKYGMSILVGVGAGVVLHNLIKPGEPLMRSNFHMNYGVPVAPGLKMPAIGAKGKNKDKTDLLPAPAGANDKTHPQYYTAYKGVVVHRRPMYIATMADRDTWLRWLANKVEEVKKNRKKDSDEIARLKDKNKDLEKGWTSANDEKKIKKNKDTIKSLEAKLKQHDVRKEWYSNGTAYVRDLYERISKASTPEEKQAAAAGAQDAQKAKDSGGSAETTAEPVSAEETVVAETPPPEDVTTVSSDTAPPAEPTFFDKYKLFILLGGGVALAGGAYFYFKSDSE